MITINRSLKPAAYRHSIALRGFAANLGESAGLFPVFVGRLWAALWDRLFSRIGIMSLNGSGSPIEAAAKQGGDDDETQSNRYNATFALTAAVGGFNAMPDDLLYGLGDAIPATRINRCWSQVLPGGTCP